MKNTIININKKDEQCGYSKNIIFGIFTAQGAGGECNQLIDEGNTIPFISRYRKEMTGSLDDQILRKLNEHLSYLRNLQKRKEEIENAITEQGKMTEEIQQVLNSAVTLTELEK